MAGQHKVGSSSQLRAEAVLLKDGRGPLHARDSAGIRCFQPHQDAQQRCFPAAGASHQHCRAIDRPCKILQNRRIAKAFAEVPYHNAHACTSPQRRIFAVRSSRAAAADSAADSSTITSVHANTSGVDSVILAR